MNEGWVSVAELSTARLPAGCEIIDQRYDVETGMRPQVFGSAAWGTSVTVPPTWICVSTHPATLAPGAGVGSTTLTSTALPVVGQVSAATPQGAAATVLKTGVEVL